MLLVVHQYHGFLNIPKLVSHNEDETALAIERLLPSEGWDFSNSWTKERLDRTIEIAEKLSSIIPSDEDRHLFTARPIDKSYDGWIALEKSDSKKSLILKKINDYGRQDISESIIFKKQALESESFVPNFDKLVHNDLSHLNCPWNPVQKKVNIIDAEEANKIFDVLMGNEVMPRKKFIQAHASEAILDL